MSSTPACGEISVAKRKKTGKYFRMKKEDYLAERATHAAYYAEHLEHSFRSTYSWTERIYKGTYRRNLVTQPTSVFNFSTFVSE